MEKKTKERKKLAEMNLLDDFLFGSMVTYPEIGEKFVRSLLKTILGREMNRLSVTAQKVFYGEDSDLHGARLDVWLEPEITEEFEGNATVYDIEPDQKDNQADRKMLPRRVRFYHGKLAAGNLSSGADYDKLKDAIIIMILPYDPFGLDRMVYTVKNKCVEVPEMEYEDGAVTLFLYTKGKEGVPGEALRQLLHYMEDTRYENAVNEDLREMHRMVETVKKDRKVIRMRMQIVKDMIRQSEEITKLEDKTAKQAEEITKQTEEITRLEDKTAKQAEEIKKLREELDRKNNVEKTD